MRRIVSLSVMLLAFLALSDTLPAAEDQRLRVSAVEGLMRTTKTVSAIAPQVRTIIHLDPKVYVLPDTYRINRSNLQIIASPGTKVILADHVNKPVVAIGTQDEVPTTVVENISISGVEIDGNKANQDSELDVDLPWIRNNGIDIRAARRSASTPPTPRCATIRRRASAWTTTSAT